MRVLLGISGGLDSAYSARILMAAGHTVEGATLLMHDFTELDESKRAAEEIGIPLHIIDCRARFDETVKTNFVNEYLKGRTPNPCIICNSEIKFRFLYEYALANGFDRIATGHYARICNTSDGNLAISLAKDTKKDQTYMLWRLSQDVLSRLILPLGDREKREIRQAAAEEGLNVASRAESQEICFIPDGDYAGYIEGMHGECKKGSFIDRDGNVLGEHGGIIRYTVGQRKGLGIALGARMFVTDIDPTANTVTLSAEDALSDTVYIEGIIFSGDRPMTEGDVRQYKVKLRYLQPPVDCTLTYLGEGRAELRLASPQRAVTPGQSAVLYRDGYVALGGFITKKNN